MTLYAAPGTEGSIVDYRERYDNYIGGQWVAPVDGEYMDNISPVTVSYTHLTLPTKRIV